MICIRFEGKYINKCIAVVLDLRPSKCGIDVNIDQLLLNVVVVVLHISSSETTGGTFTATIVNLTYYDTCCLLSKYRMCYVQH